MWWDCRKDNGHLFDGIVITKDGDVIELPKFDEKFDESNNAWIIFIPEEVGK